MCGIVGYVGTSEAVPILLKGLRHLEYRGYDSAGVALLHAGEVEVTRSTDRLAGLETKLRNLHAPAQEPRRQECGRSQRDLRKLHDHSGRAPGSRSSAAQRNGHRVLPHAGFASQG